VEINPQSNILKSGIGGDERNPVYIRYGGKITIFQEVAMGSYELWEETLGKVATVGLNGLTTTNLGIYPQWHKFIFYIKHIYTGQKYYPLPTSSEIVGIHSGVGWLEFEPSYHPGDPIPYPPAFVWNLIIDPFDLGLAAMPPPEILSADFITNPFQPSEDITIPFGGIVYAVITKAKTQGDALWIDKPSTQLIMNELGNHTEDTLNFGHMSGGEAVRFFLLSPNSIVSGINMYPRLNTIEQVMPDGEILLSELDFEDWTDLFFDDVGIDLYIHPDSGAYAGPITVFSNPEQIAPGDTSEITFKKRHLDGTLEDIPEWRTFEIGMLDGCALGKLSKDGVDTNYLYGVTQPIYFIANSSAENGTVKVRAGLIEEISAASMISSNEGVNGKNKKTGKRYDIIIKQTKNIKVNVNYNSNTSLQTSLENEFCYTGIYEAQEYGFGDVVVKQENEILLGETKYYAVKKKTETGELKIEEIKVIQDIAPVFPSTAGEGWEWINKKSIWSDRPINIETKGQIPIFYDKFYAQLFYSGNSKPIINDLPDGMIRVIGRYLGKTIDNKVELFTEKENGRNDTINIQVVRPTKLGDNVLNVTGPTKVDNVDKVYKNIDSLIIDIAANLGIPPQIMMGIVEKESNNYAVSYRYEPFSDVLNVQKSFKFNRYWIKSSADLGNPTIPKHNNIHDARGPISNYPGYTTVWDIYTEKNAGEHKMYTFSSYKYMKKDYWDVFNKNWVDTLEKKGVIKNLIADSARILADISYLQFIRESIGGVGMVGTIAQTRIAASYGLMQLTYNSGVKKFITYGLNYPNNNEDFLPEYIMIPDINIEYSCKHLLGKIRDSLGKIKYTEEDTWPKGYAFELSLWNGLLYYNGGSKPEYPNSVLKLAKNNLPKKN
jgi:hypothetical protein